MNYRIDTLSLRDGTLYVEGWAIGTDGKEVNFSVTDRAGKSVPSKTVRRDRADVAAQFGADLMSGFTVEVPFGRGMDVNVMITDGSEKRKLRVNEEIILKKNSIRNKKSEKLLALCHTETLRVAWEFYRKNGFHALWKKSVHKLKGIEGDYDYGEWEEKMRESAAELSLQKESWKDFPVKPLISVVIPAFNTGETYLRMLFDSLLAQTYPRLEVIVADGSTERGKVEKVTGEYAAKDSEVRFLYLDLGGNLGIAGNTNAGLKAATGDFIALCDHDDELPPSAFYKVVKAINEHKKAEFLYTDEDKIDFDGKALFEPHFKSDYNPELLETVNYICHLSVIRKDLLQKVGGFDPAFDGAQDYDFFLRCTEEAAGKEEENLKKFRKGEETAFDEEELSLLREGRFTSSTVIHVPEICYHWRYHKGSTAENPESKLYAFTAGAGAIKAHYDRLKIPYEEVEKGITYGFYHTVPKGNPGVKVSVLIPNKDHAEDLDKCIRSVIEKSTHRCFEFIVIENNSEKEETFDYYRKINGNPAFFRAEGTEDISIRVVTWKREFNYSAINNFGASFATGEVLLLLNNDVEILDGNSVTEMLSYALREGVGAVGARLNYGDDTIQHAGVIVGMGGIAGAAFVGLHEKETSYMHRMVCTQDYSAVTAACLMMRKEVFDLVGGLREELAVAFNDIDLCMKVRAKGYRVVYDPYAVWHHYESKSRGLEDTPEKVKRFNSEIAVFYKYWSPVLKEGDPYYNKYLTLRKANFALKDPAKETPGEPFQLELDVDEQLKVIENEKKRRGIG